MKRFALLALMAAILGVGSAAFAAEKCTCQDKKPSQSAGLTDIELYSR